MVNELRALTKLRKQPDKILRIYTLGRMREELPQLFKKFWKIYLKELPRRKMNPYSNK
jgi:hypothetical protein